MAKQDLPSVLRNYPTQFICDKAANEIERLEAIVDRLPKTADGVSIVQGMTVFTKPAEILLRCSVESAGIQDGQTYLVLNETPTNGCFVGGRFRFCKSPSDCYSTEAAMDMQEPEDVSC
jgi:hypothetical protein